MAAAKINVEGDARITHEHAKVNGNNYHYLLGIPKGDQKGTIFLIHGWPDISMGWRYQIPMFLDMGLRVVVPDIMGFGRTEAPEPLSDYSLKHAATDIKELARQLGSSHIILGGHDWGGAVVYRVCLWFPGFVTHLFSVCTPYWEPVKAPYVTLEERVKTVLPNFAYQLNLASGEVEKTINSKDGIRQLLSGIYGGRGPNGELIFTTTQGVVPENVGKMGPSPLLSESEMNYYVDEYARNGMHANLNWYRTSKINYDEELKLERSDIDIPTLFVCATKDAALPEWMSEKMNEQITKLTKKTVEATHWALWEKPQEVNGLIKDWLQFHYFQSAHSNL